MASFRHRMMRSGLVAGVVGAAFILPSLGSGSAYASASKSHNRVIAFAKSVTSDQQHKFGPQLQAITAAVTAGYQALDNGISSAGALEQQNLQQGTQQLSPDSPQYQQENQCVQAAGANYSAIEQCLQTAEQPFTSNEQAQSNATNQAIQESEAEVKAAAGAFSNLGAVFLGEGEKLHGLGLTGRGRQLEAGLIVDYAKLGADCVAGEDAASIGATGTAEHTLSTDALKWVGDYNAFTDVVGMSRYSIS